MHVAQKTLLTHALTNNALVYLLQVFYSCVDETQDINHMDRCIFDSIQLCECVSLFQYITL